VGTKNGNALTVNDVSINTISIQIKAITVGNRQMTLSIFRQIKEESPIDDKFVLKGLLWGTVNYFPEHDELTHYHVLWQKGEELRRGYVRRDAEFDYFASDRILGCERFLAEAPVIIEAERRWSEEARKQREKTLHERMLEVAKENEYREEVWRGERKLGDRHNQKDSLFSHYLQKDIEWFYSRERAAVVPLEDHQQPFWRRYPYGEKLSSRFEDMERLSKQLVSTQIRSSEDLAAAIGPIEAELAQLRIARDQFFANRNRFYAQLAAADHLFIAT